MATFRTELHLRQSDHRIRHGNSILTIGSCFAEVMGSKLAGSKFSVLVNPFGTLYDPLSIHRVLQYATHNELPADNTYVHSGENWFNYEFHSSLNGVSKKEAEKVITDAIGTARHFLQDVETLIITYGTAKIFELAANSQPIANCHKIPSTHFTSRILSPESIIESFDELFKSLNKGKPGIRIILTVSPVRHLKETPEINSVSKSVLRWACHNITERYSGVEYFPAYEIMMDDLRDYRFYQEDMIHPSAEAIRYIWDKFSDVYFDSSTKSVITKWLAVSAALNHRSFHSASIAHQQFLKETLLKLEELKSMIPVTEEIASIQSQLA